MEITGTLNRIGDIQRITNAQTGKTFVKRDITIVVKEEFYTREGIRRIADNELAFALLFESAENFNIEPGTKVKIYYSSLVTAGNNFYENKTVRNITFAN